MVTKEKRKEYRQNFINKLGKELYKLYIANQTRKYYLKNSKKKLAYSREWREKNPDYNKNYYRQNLVSQ